MEYGTSMMLRGYAVCYQIVIEDHVMQSVTASTYDTEKDEYLDLVLTSTERAMILAHAKKEWDL